MYCSKYKTTAETLTTTTTTITITIIKTKAHIQKIYTHNTKNIHISQRHAKYTSNNDAILKVMYIMVMLNDKLAMRYTVYSSSR